MEWRNDHPLPWSVGPLGLRGQTTIIDSNGKTALDMGWLIGWECDKATGLPIASDRQKEDWGERILNDPESLNEMFSDDRWESKQTFDIATFIVAAVNQAGGK